MRFVVGWCKVVRVIGAEHIGAALGTRAVIHSGVLASAPIVLREIFVRSAQCRREIGRLDQSRRWMVNSAH